jgi:hypothetical protein
MSDTSNTPTLSGTFSEEKAKAFIKALSKLTKVGVEKVILEFKTGDVKSLYINALNSISTVTTRISFDSSILDGFTLQNDFNYGISNLEDFVGILNIFDAGFELKMSTEIASLSSNENYLDYYGAEISKLMKNRGEDGEIDSPILATITCDDSFKEFLTATDKLMHDHIIFRSNLTGNFITLSVADKDVRGNSFTKKISTPVTSDFKVVINKLHFSSILSVGTSFTIYKEAIQLKKVENLYNIEYIIITLR